MANKKYKRSPFQTLLRLGREIEKEHERKERIQREAWDTYMELCRRRKNKDCREDKEEVLSSKWLHKCICSIPEIYKDTGIEELREVLPAVLWKHSEKRTNKTAKKYPEMSLEVCRALLSSRERNAITNTAENLFRMLSSLCNCFSDPYTSQVLDVKVELFIECICRAEDLNKKSAVEAMIGIGALKALCSQTAVLSGVYKVLEVHTELFAKPLGRILGKCSSADPCMLESIFSARKTSYQHTLVCILGFSEYLRNNKEAVKEKNFAHMSVQLSLDILEVYRRSSEKKAYVGPLLRFLEYFLKTAGRDRNRSVNKLYLEKPVRQIKRGLWKAFARSSSLKLLKLFSFAHALSFDNAYTLSPASKETKRRERIITYLQRGLQKKEVLYKRIVPIWSNMPCLNMHTDAYKHLVHILEEAQGGGMPAPLFVCFVSWGCANTELSSALVSELPHREVLAKHILHGVSYSGCTLREKDQERVLLHMQTFFAEPSKGRLESISWGLRCISQSRQTEFLSNVCDWVCKSFGVKTQQEWGFRAVLMLSESFVSLPQALQMFSLLLEESSRTQSSNMFSALKALYTRTAAIQEHFLNNTSSNSNSNSNSNIDSGSVREIFLKCISKLAFLVDVSPLDALSDLYSFAYACICTFPHLEEWKNVSEAVIDRLGLYSPNKAQKEAKLLGRISKQYFQEVCASLAPYALKPARYARKAFLSAIKEISLSAPIAATVQYLEPLYKKDSFQEQKHLLSALQQCVLLCHSKGVPCRGAVHLLLPLIEKAVVSTCVQVQILGGKLAEAVAISAWGVPADYEVCVHLFNLVFPLVLSRATQECAIQILPVFERRLSLEFLSVYMISGMQHPSPHAQAGIRRAYTALTHKNIQTHNRAQEILHFLFSPKEFA
ncbi:hypothetical protein NECID01_2035 [Nematocida sp. AWRm77]|nr:hypothetical protein NECID01_2035 [Nematocida sp. AWRm77]